MKQCVVDLGYSREDFMTENEIAEYRLLSDEEKSQKSPMASEIVQSA